MEAQIDMNDPEKEVLVERIRKLLNMRTENGATQAEMESSIALAQRLMRKYGIDPDQIKTAGHVRELIVWSGRRCYEEIEVLAGFICHYFNVVGLRADRAGQCNVVFAGRESDLAVAGHVWSYLFRNGQLLWLRRKSFYRGIPKARYSYWVGLTSGVSRKLEVQLRQAVREQPGLSTALVTTRKTLQTAVLRDHPHMDKRQRSPSDVTNLHALTAGIDDSRGLSIVPAMPAEASHV